MEHLSTIVQAVNGYIWVSTSADQGEIISNCYICDEAGTVLDWASLYTREHPDWTEAEKGHKIICKLMSYRGVTA